MVPLIQVPCPEIRQVKERQKKVQLHERNPRIKSPASGPRLVSLVSLARRAPAMPPNLEHCLSPVSQLFGSPGPSFSAFQKGVHVLQRRALVEAWHAELRDSHASGPSHSAKAPGALNRASGLTPSLCAGLSLYFRCNRIQNYPHTAGLPFTQP